MDWLTWYSTFGLVLDVVASCIQVNNRTNDSMQELRRGADLGFLVIQYCKMPCSTVHRSVLSTVKDTETSLSITVYIYMCGERGRVTVYAVQYL